MHWVQTSGYYPQNANSLNERGRHPTDNDLRRYYTTFGDGHNPVSKKGDIAYSKLNRNKSDRSVPQPSPRSPEGLHC